MTSWDLMFLQLSAQDLLTGKRRNCSERSQAVIASAVSAPPFDHAYPCCGLTRSGKVERLSGRARTGTTEAARPGPSSSLAGGYVTRLRRA